MSDTLEQAMLESELALADETLITPVNEYLLIDPETRLIEVPESESLFGVYSENDVEVKHFACPKIVLNNIDLFQMYIFINYVSASGRYGQTLAKNIKTSEDGNYITFDWELTRNVFDLNTNGKIYFAVMAKKQIEDKEPVFATRKASGDFYETIEAGEVIQEQHADIILEMLTRIEALERGGTGGSSFSGKASDVSYDDTETKLGVDNVQDAISKVSKEVFNLTVGAFIDYDANVKAVNHRGYSTEAPENTIPAYILSKQKGFKYVECDVAFTKDGVAVLLHDGTIDRTSDGTGGIWSLTYEELLQYDFGSWKSSSYTGTKIPTFEEFIKLCKNIGLHPYIELKSSSSYTEVQIQSLVDIVESYGMKGKVTWISFNATFLGYVKNYDDTARIGFLANTVSETEVTKALGLKTENNEVFIDMAYNYATEDVVSLCIENDLPLEIWTVDSESVIKNMNGYVSGVTSNNLIAGKVLYDANMTYTPPETPDEPDVPEDATLSSISATYTGGNVTVGTSLSSLTGLTVKATYSDGSTENITGYTLSGEIVEGENTITVTYQGFTTTFAVVGVAESGGDEPSIDTGNALYYWDFTQSLYDLVENKEAKLLNGTKQSEDGLVAIEKYWHQLGINSIVSNNRTIEIDIASMTDGGFTTHGRTAMFNTDSEIAKHNSEGFIWRSTGSWQFYINSTWSNDSANTD